MNDTGLLTKSGLVYLLPLFNLWENHLDASSRKQLEEKCSFLTKTKLLRRGVHIKACAVWDTVGSLGLPMVGLIPQPTQRKLKFVNSELCPIIDNAFQALALYEHRRHFRPIVWRARNNDQQTLKQCWFLGYHGDVGGGRKDAALSHIALVWIISQLKDFLSLDISNLWAPVAEINLSMHEGLLAGDISVGFPEVDAVIVSEISTNFQLNIPGSVSTGFTWEMKKKRRGLNGSLHPITRSGRMGLMNSAYEQLG
jgi:uncharacterized protein (DUF2235 family)